MRAMQLLDAGMKTLVDFAASRELGVQSLVTRFHVQKRLKKRLIHS